MHIITRNTTHPRRIANGQKALCLMVLRGSEKAYMEIRQLDSDHYVLDGLNDKPIRVKGWVDGVRLIRNA